MIRFFLITIACIGFLNNAVIAQKNIDSCKVFVTNYAAQYYSRISPENLIYDFSDSSFQISDSIYNKVLLIFNDESKILENRNLVKVNLNRYNVDCRLIFLFYHGKNYDVLGFGSNSLMMFNDKVYECNKQFLAKISSTIPCLSKFLNW